MNEQIGVSGCFGSAPQYEQIDTVEEASAVVEGLQEDVPMAADPEVVGQEYMLTIQQLATVAGEYARRIRLLTWAVVAIVVYLVLTNAKE